MPSQTVERREFFRVPFTRSLKYKAYSNGSLDGTTRNISQSGILFSTDQAPPRVSSIVWLSLDMRTLGICREIESRALILNNGILGRVVRVEEDPSVTKTYDVGVCFLNKEQWGEPEVTELLKTI